MRTVDIPNLNSNANGIIVSYRMQRDVLLVIQHGVASVAVGVSAGRSNGGRQQTGRHHGGAVKTARGGHAVVLI